MVFIFPSLSHCSDVWYILASSLPWAIKSVPPKKYQYIISLPHHATFPNFPLFSLFGFASHSWYPFHGLPHKHLMFYFWKKSKTRKWQEEIQFTFQGEVMEEKAIVEKKYWGILSVWNNEIKLKKEKEEGKAWSIEWHAGNVG